MTAPLTAPFVLPSDVLLIPVAELSANDRARLDAADTDFAITRPRSRTSSSVVDADSAELLGRFRDARTIVEAVIDFSRARGADPHEVLTGAYPVFRRLISAGLLLPSGDQLAQPVVASFEAGDRIGDYEIVRRISLLYDVELYQALAHDGSLVLLKVARAAGGARIVRTLRHEAAMLERAADSSVPRLLHTGEQDALPWLAIEWREGVTPVRAGAEFRRTPGGAARQSMVALCASIADAYARLHASGLAHGDVHDFNVLVDRRGEATLIDFGLASDLGETTRGAPGRAGVFLYHDPELAASLLANGAGAPATAVSEQYAVGVLLYQVITGLPYLELPIRRESALRQILAADPLSFGARSASPWPEMETVLTRMLAKNPAERFASMADVANALRSIVVDDHSGGSSTSEASGASSASRTVSTTRIANAVFDRLTLDAALYRSGLPIGPQCSVNNGAAGIAYAWYRLALLHENGDDLAIANAWARRAVTWMDRDEAFFLRDKTIAPQNVGRAGLFHSAMGVHCVRALVANAGGDVWEANHAVDDMTVAARSRSDKWDLCLGRTGILLGCSLLHEAAIDPSPVVRKLGARVAQAMTQRLADAGVMSNSRSMDNLGMAHGWAGVLYALLRWCQATGSAPPPSVVARLDELAANGQHIGRGMSWLTYRDHSSSGMQSTWCNGDTGHALLWLLAAQALGDARYVGLAEQAAWNVADRGPNQMYDLCCGAAGRAYAFLALYRRTGDPLWLRRAKQFADHAGREIDPDAPTAHRLYKGALGAALLLFELEDPSRARMPLFEPEGWQWRRPRRA
jgi:eukaryotic-like serine/threonine-protein kinase